METTKEKEVTFTPGPWVISRIDGVEDSLMVGGGDDGSDIVADIRTHENDILKAQAELYDDIPVYRSRINVHGNCWVTGYDTKSLDKHEKEVKERLAELESIEKDANANARLIASAPEMYELLGDLSKVIENLESMGASLPYYFKDDMSMSDKLRELLAKVDGGEG